MRYWELIKVVLAMLTRFNPAIASPVSIAAVVALPPSGSATVLLPLIASRRSSLSIVASPTILTSSPSWPLQADSSQLVRRDASRRSMVGAVSVKLEKRMPPGEFIKVVLRRLRMLARTTAEPERIVGFEIVGVVLVNATSSLVSAGQLTGGLPDPEPVSSVEEALVVSSVDVACELEPKVRSSPRKPLKVELEISETDSITVDEDIGMFERKSSTRVSEEVPIPPVSSAPVTVACTSVLSCSSFSETVASIESEDDEFDSLDSELDDDCSSCVCMSVEVSDDSLPFVDEDTGVVGSLGATVS